MERQFVTYKLALRRRRNKPDELIKRPYNPHTGELASVTDPDTWGTAEEAAEAVRRYRMNGPGIVVMEGKDLRGTDLDHCYDPATGQVTEQAMRIVRLLNSYTEITPSGVGLRVFVKARDYIIPEGQRVKQYEGQKVEMYGSGRFFTITGRHLPGTPFTVEERSAELRQAHEMIWGADAENGGAPLGADGNFARPTCGVTGLSDEAVLEKCRSDAKGEKFRALYDDGDLSDISIAYDDHLADCTVWSKLIFYIGDDRERIKRFAEQGEHYKRSDTPAEAAERRAKWQRPYPPYGTFQDREIAYLLAGRGPESVYGGRRSGIVAPDAGARRMKEAQKQTVMIIR